MRNFSQRIGLEPIKVDLQIDSMSDQLRIGLWNALYIAYFSDVRQYRHTISFETLAKPLWVNHYKLPLDQLLHDDVAFTTFVKKCFFSCEWNKTFELIEDFLKYSRDAEKRKTLVDNCNIVLENELSGYRLINYEFTPIISKREKGEIESALRNAPKWVNQHLGKALNLFSDREKPDHSNSIKESITAVETLCCLIARKSNATLGEAIKLINRSGVVSIHPALEEALKKLYGWTSDEAGIRHGKPGESSVG